jgi:subtilisin family serine protease
MNRPRGPATVAAIVLAIAAAFGPSAGSAAGAVDPLAVPGENIVWRDAREVLRGGLRVLASDRLASREHRTIPGELITREGRFGTEVAVTISLDGAADAGVLDRLTGGGARVVNVGTGTAEAYVAPEDLSALARIPGVRSVRPIRRPLPTYVSPGVTLQGASSWQTAGITGAGVKVGIIDNGFAGLVARLGTELPSTVHARCYTAVGVFTSDVLGCDNGENHGTAVAETVADMAPGVELFIADPISRLDEQQTVAWMTSNGVRIISASRGSGYVFDGPGDGTSPYVDSIYTSVDQAVAGGALWVNSAGNAGDKGWTGSWTDTDGDGLLEWGDGDARNSMTLAAGQEVAVAIRWADPWGASSNDYDLELWSGTFLVASSEDVQAGAGDPFEWIEYTAPASGTYDIAVRTFSGTPTTRMQLLVVSQREIGLLYQVAAGTLPAPADSANPGMVTVGAVNVASPGTIEPYSSRGPTLDGRIKPDLVAIDCAPTTVTAFFCGTSESAPFVTGAAALILQVDPALTPSQLADQLRSHTVPLGSPVPNATYGWGRLDLGAVPIAPASGLAFSHPPTGAVAGAPLTGQPAIRIVDASGSTVSAGSSSSATVTLTLGSNPTGATLACDAGLSRAAVAGFAHFTGCSIDKPGAGYTIGASTPDLPPVVSAPFEILAEGSSLPLTIFSSAGTVTWPAGITLAGQFSPIPSSSGRLIEFQTSLDGARWTAIGSGTTDTAGLAGLSNQPTTSVRYRAFYAGAPDLPAATSYPITVTVRQKLTLTASVPPPRTIAVGRTVTFTSTVKPPPGDLPRATVTFVVYRRVGTTWVLFRRVEVVADTAGRARFSWRFSRTGAWYVRAMAKATPYVAASAWSPVARYDVR